MALPLDLIRRKFKTMTIENQCLVSRDPVATMLGIKLNKLSPEATVVELTPQACHLNNMGIVHGAIIYAMIDQAAAIASNAFEYDAVLCQGQVDFLNPGASDCKLYATASPISVKRRLSVWEVKVTDENQVLIATGRTTAYHFL
jgi:acyl-CoA thioesterase